METLYPGIYTLTFGTPEALTPVALRDFAPAVDALEGLPALPCPFAAADLRFRTTGRGCQVELPLSGFEQLYGFGLQLKSFGQLAKKKTMRCNADPVADTGDSHAPVPFYVSTDGYGVLADSARQVHFYCGANAKPGQTERRMTIEIPHAQGVTLYIFAGQNILGAVQRYNLFSGGGAMPPAWGLGVWYRCYTRGKRPEIEGFAQEFRDRKLPVTVLGLEPSWHTKAYSCSFLWNEDNFPDHENFVANMRAMGYQLNLWEHVFTHPTAALYEKLLPFAGEYAVWDGLAPDLSLPEARALFAGYHQKEFAEKGVSGFKLDECDGSDFTGGWSYPDAAAFPSGLEGERMHNLIGLLYQHAIRRAFDPLGERTWGLVRASGALAAPSPFTVYSDLYDHRDYIRGMVNMGFSGLLWIPEVRNAAGMEDFIRRLQTVIFAPVAMINAWPFPLPPWKQVNDALNHAGVIMENTLEAEAVCRSLFELRSALAPYLYTAFRKYQTEGVPPIRALVLDTPEDEDCWNTEDAVLIGDSLYFAPLVAGETEKTFYLPKGQWVDFFAPGSAPLEGGKNYTFTYDLDHYPLFVRAGTLLPLCDVQQFIPVRPQFALRPVYYGAAPTAPVAVALYEDDGHSLNAPGRTVRLVMQPGGSCSLERTGDGTEMYTIAGGQQ